MSHFHNVAHKEELRSLLVSTPSGIRTYIIGSLMGLSLESNFRKPWEVDEEWEGKYDRLVKDALSAWDGLMVINKQAVSNAACGIYKARNEYPTVSVIREFMRGEYGNSTADDDEFLFNWAKGFRGNSSWDVFNHLSYGTELNEVSQQQTDDTESESENDARYQDNYKLDHLISVATDYHMTRIYGHSIDAHSSRHMEVLDTVYKNVDAIIEKMENTYGETMPISSAVKVFKDVGRILAYIHDGASTKQGEIVTPSLEELVLGAMPSVPAESDPLHRGPEYRESYSDYLIYFTLVHWLQDIVPAEDAEVIESYFNPAYTEAVPVDIANQLSFCIKCYLKAVKEFTWSI